MLKKFALPSLFFCLILATFACKGKGSSSENKPVDSTALTLSDTSKPVPVAAGNFQNNSFTSSASGSFKLIRQSANVSISRITMDYFPSGAKNPPFDPHPIGKQYIKLDATFTCTSAEAYEFINMYFLVNSPRDKEVGPCIFFNENNSSDNVLQKTIGKGESLSCGLYYLIDARTKPEELILTANGFDENLRNSKMQFRLK